jgi:hypothetical protein
MKHYTPKQVNEIKQQIRTGKPLPIIAEDLAVEWERPSSGIYSKAVALARNTRRITNTWTGPTKKTKLRPTIVQQSIDFDLMPGSLLDATNDKSEVILKEICEEIVDKEFVTVDEFKEIWNAPKQEPAEIGIEVPPTNISFNGIPSRVVIYSDHVRYYYNN